MGRDPRRPTSDKALTALRLLVTTTSAAGLVLTGSYAASAQNRTWSVDQPAAGSCGVTTGGQIIGAQTMGWAANALSGNIDGIYGPDTQGAIDHIWNITVGGSHQSGCMNSTWYSGAETLLVSIGSGTTHPSESYSGPRGNAYYDYSKSAYAPTACTWTTDDYHTSLPLGGGLTLGHYVWIANSNTKTTVAGYADC